MTSDSLLAHLAWRFPGATEDIATEALLYILRKQEGARTALAELLRSGGANPEPMDSFDTQRVYQQSKKPDLVAFNGERAVLLVESKFQASLTPHQPNGYLSLMRDELREAKSLLFIAPEARQSGLWDELWEQAGKQFEVTDEQTAGGVQSATVGNGGLRLMLTSWDTLLNCLEHSGTDVDGDLRQLRGLCAPASDDPLLTSGVPANLAAVSHFETLIKRAVALAKERGYISTRGLRPSRWQGNYGRFVWFVNPAGQRLAVARIGVDFSQTGSPLFLLFIDNLGQFTSDQMEEIRARLGGDLHLSISIPPRAAYAVALEAVVDKLQEIRGRLTISG